MPRGPGLDCQRSRSGRKRAHGTRPRGGAAGGGPDARPPPRGAAPPYGLLRQSYAPRRQRRGRLNADGWGVGLYAADLVEPVRWRSDRPLWSDASFASVAPVLSSTCVLAAVRSATKGMPVAETATAPFSDGRWLLSHNGRVDRATLTLDGTAESTCDSALLAVHVFARGPDRLRATGLDLARPDPPPL